MRAMFLSGSRSRLGLPLARWFPGVTYLVEPQELDAYQAAHAEQDFRCLPEGGRGFGYMLNRMLETCEAEGSRWLWFLDDDLLGLLARPTTGSKWERFSKAEARALLESLVDLAEGNQLAQLAVSFKGHSWAATKAYVEPTGAWGLHLTSIAAARDVGGYDEGLPIFNDWDLSARLLLAGYRCVRTNLVTFEHKMASQPGGAELVYKDRGRVDQAIAMLTARYPGICRVKWVEAHGQPEVRFDWKRAALPARRLA